MSPKEKKDWSPDPFPEPRTFPNGWDGSALTSTNGKQDSGNASDSKPNIRDVDGWQPEKFPKPRTFPKNWSIDD